MFDQIDQNEKCCWTSSDKLAGQHWAVPILSTMAHWLQSSVITHSRYWVFILSTCLCSVWTLNLLLTFRMTPSLSLLLLLLLSLTGASPVPPSEEVLSRTRRTIGPVSFGRVSLIGTRLQIFPHPPFGVNNNVLFDVDVVVPRWLAAIIPGQ